MIEVAVAGDAKIAVPFMAMMQTLLESIREEPIRVHVVDTGLKALTDERLQAMSADSGKFFVRWISLTSADYDRLPATPKYPKENFMRLIFPELLPELDRVFWLDCDLLVRQDIAEFWNTPAGDAPIVGVPEFGARSLRGMLAAPLLEMLPAASRVLVGFNAGVIIMNLEMWRRQSLGDRALNLCARYADVLSFPDQEVLNMLCAGEWKEVALRWNVQMGAIRSIPRVPAETINEGVLARRLELVHQPAIIHFAGDKPWAAGIKNPFREDFFQAVKRSGYMSGLAFLRYKAHCTRVALTSFVAGRRRERSTQAALRS